MPQIGIIESMGYVALDMLSCCYSFRGEASLRGEGFLPDGSDEDTSDINYAIIQGIRQTCTDICGTVRSLRTKEAIE